MIITCPNCQTKYQVADNAIGSAGRKVQCANCHNSWQATASMPERPREVVAPPPPPRNDDRLFDSRTEAELDRDFEEAERQALASTMNESPVSDAPPADDEVEAVTATGDEDASEEAELDASLQSRRLRDLKKRQRKLASKLPMARIRRMARMGGLLLLVTLVGVGIFMRESIVRAFPDLGGVYDAVGLGVNVVGLDFPDLSTLRTLRDGKEVMIITSSIRNVTGRNVAVPPVMVSLIGADGTSIYQWTVRPQAQVLAPGELVAFETQLQAPPEEADRVRLVFAGSGETTTTN